MGEKLVKMLGFCQNWIFEQKFDFSNSVNYDQLVLMTTKYILDEEWGDEDEWEWEADNEDIDKPNSESNITKTSKLPSPPPAPAPLSNIKTVNGVNGNLMMNGLHKNNGAPPPSNGTHNNRKSSTVINHEDQEIEEVNGKADIKIEGNLLTIKRTGPIDWSDDEYEEEEELIPTSLPPPPPPPPPPVPPPPPPPMPAGMFFNFCL